MKQHSKLLHANQETDRMYPFWLSVSLLQLQQITVSQGWSTILIWVSNVRTEMVRQLVWYCTYYVNLLLWSHQVQTWVLYPFIWVFKHDAKNYPKQLFCWILPQIRYLNKVKVWRILVILIKLPFFSWKIAF